MGTDMPQIEVPISTGELLDRITILQNKMSRFRDEVKRRNVERELTKLQGICDEEIELDPVTETLVERLREVNSSLWDVEDQLRDLESRQCFDERFVDLARSVYRLNDWRSGLKRELSRYLGSEFVEEKEYGQSGR